MAKRPMEKNVVNIDSVRIRGKDQGGRIYKVGIELEGGWSTVPNGTEIIRDGSVGFNSSEMAHYNLLHVGELPSPPKPLTDDMHGWKAWLRSYYPTYSNASCGMHVHMSFKTALCYQRLMDPRFQSTIISYVSKWATGRQLAQDHPLWPRLRGESPYCQHIFAADEQAQVGSKDYNRERRGHRYTVIHYPFKRLNTIECRLLPMMATVQLAESAIQEILDITNGFLVATAIKEKRARIEIGDSEGESLNSNIRVII